MRSRAFDGSVFIVTQEEDGRKRVDTSDSIDCGSCVLCGFLSLFVLLSSRPRTHAPQAIDTQAPQPLSPPPPIFHKHTHPTPPPPPPPSPSPRLPIHQSTASHQPPLVPSTAQTGEGSDRTPSLSTTLRTQLGCEMRKRTCSSWMACFITVTASSRVMPSCVLLCYVGGLLVGETGGSAD